MKRFLIFVLLANLILTACASAPTATPEPTGIPLSAATALPTNTPISTSAPTATPSATALPTSTPTPTATSTVTPIPTPTPIPTLPPDLIAGLQGVPDPRYSNPELFDLSRTDAPIPQFANAFGVSPEEVINDLKAELITSAKGNRQLPVMVTADGVVLMLAEQGAGGHFVWTKATVGSYWHKLGKYVGLYLPGDLTKDPQVTQITSEFFKEGILSLDGQVRPGPDIEERKPTNSAATRSFQWAQAWGMALNFHYVLEPGKFPNYVSKENVDEWLRGRLSEVADVLLQYKPARPVLIEFNEPWLGDVWNPERNPLQDKYGEKWLAECVFQTLDVMISKGLMPNHDFVILFNDDDTNPSPFKQKIMHEQLKEARNIAYGRLVTDFKVSTKLSESDIVEAEDIEIWLGVQAHITLGNRSEGDSRTLAMFGHAPTVEQINALADSFGDLGGVVLTEVTPANGDTAQKREFLAEMISVMASNENLNGIILGNLFLTRPEDIYAAEPLVLFDARAEPTQMYFEFLRIHR